MAQQHDGHEGRQFFPEGHTRVTERHRCAENECNRDRQGNERHHAGQPVAKLADGPLNEHPPSVNKYNRAEDWRNPSRTEKLRCGISKRTLEHVSSDERGNSQGKRDPEFIAEHRHAVPSVFVVGSMWIVCGVFVRGGGTRSVALGRFSAVVGV